MTTANETDGRKPAPGLTFSVRTEGGSVFEVVVVGPVVTIGRDRDCTVCFGDVPTVSGRHAEITVRDGRCTITDSRSQNHTFVNGVRLDAPAPLGLHDEIRLGMNGPRLRLVAINAAGRADAAAGRPSAGAASRDHRAAVDESDGAAAAAPRPARDLLVARRAPERSPEHAAREPERRGTRPADSTVGWAATVPRIAEATASSPGWSWLPLVAVLVALGGALWAGLLPSLANLRSLFGMPEQSVALIRCVTKGAVFPEIVSESGGSGFLIDAQGRLATTYHVIAGIDEATVRFAGDDAWHPVAGAVFASPGLDLAIIDVGAAAARGKRPLRLDAKTLAGADEIVAIGSSGGLEFVSGRGTVEKTALLGSVADRLLSHRGDRPAVDGQAAAATLEKLRALRADYDQLDARGRQDFFDKLFQIEGGPQVTTRDWIRHLEHELAETKGRPAGESSAGDVSIVIHGAPIAPGNTGGPLLDAAGAVVGVNAGVLSRGEGDRDLRYAIAARHLVENLPPAGVAAKPFAESAR